LVWAKHYVDFPLVFIFHKCENMIFLLLPVFTMNPSFVFRVLRRPGLGLLPLLLLGSPARAAEPPPVANVIMGGAERRCSSFTGNKPSPECTTDWATILQQDPTFQGLTPDDILFENDYPEPVWTYSLNTASLQALRASPNRLFDVQRKAAVLARLEDALIQAPLNHQPWQALEAAALPPAWQKNSGLSLAELSVLRNALVDAPAPAQRKVQARSQRFSSNAASVRIFDTFVAAARVHSAGNTPLIGVVTASGGPHPFVDHDLNVFALRSAGAQVVYLPLEGGFRQALDAHDCANLRYYYDSYANTNPERAVFHSHLLFPDLAQQQQNLCNGGGVTLNALLGQLHGIYFSGGNQARHLESLVNRDAAGRYTGFSAQWQIIQSRHAQGKLVVAGTSAGNHIQGGGLWHGRTVPMVGGGDAYDVLKNGYATGQGPAYDTATAGIAEANARYPAVIYPEGGLGTFRFGVLDSHFSRRTREARLIRAVADSGMDYGFGVDENTALVVSQTDTAGTTHFSVVGAAGVFIVDMRTAQVAPAGSQAWAVQGAVAHYLLPGDTARIDAAGQLQVQLATDTALLPLAADAAPAMQDRLLDYGSTHFLALARTMGRQGAALGWGSTEGSTDKRSLQNAPYYRATLLRGPDTVFRGSAATDAQATGVRYTHLQIGFTPCEGPCRPPAPH
jgi:cyanophycinase